MSGIKDETELRRRINENLKAVQSGRRARELEEEKRAAARRRERLKEAAVRIRQISKTLKELHKEREGLQEYLDELLLREGCELVDECDQAIEGVSAEIDDLTTELQDLLSI